MQFVIEHLDPEVFPWSLLEYTHISSVVGKDKLVFTNVLKDGGKLDGLGSVHKESVKDMIVDKKIDFKKVCVLDPLAEKELSVDDDFDYFVFGGVLGNDPMDGRTEREITSFLPFSAKRSLGDKQMSTDTAVHVVKKIVVDKIEFKDMVFIDDPEIRLGQGYSQILPYRYLVVNDQLVFTPGLIQLLKDEDQ
jgi:ribosome biogenesis SPOUT family RNA methylase Rps3